MKILVKATLGPLEIRFRGRNPWILQRTFTFEVDTEAMLTLLLYHSITLQDQCFLKFECKEENISIDEATGLICFVMKGHIKNSSNEFLASMITHGWKRIISEEDRGQFYPGMMFPEGTEIFEIEIH